tara:strand:- start:2067 stop:3209 length:1143 start_codon:yes stop_codon:yes gene_type:complete
MSLIYHKLQPENVLTSYNEFQNVDFLLTFEGRAIELNTIRMTADCIISSTEDMGDKTKSTKIFYNPSVGGNGVIENITTSINGRVVESLNEVGRYCSMRNQASVGSNERCSGMLNAQGITSNARFTNSLIRGSPSTIFAGDSAQADTYTEPFNFTIAPECCLNNAYTTDGTAPLLSFTKSGAIRLSIRLARNSAFLYGSDQDSNTGKYELQNISCSFTSRPDVKDKQVLMRTKISLKQSVESDYANIGAVVPATCNAMSMSFQPQPNEFNNFYDNYALYRVPDYQQLQYLFNDSTNQYLTFILKNQIEAYERGIESLRDTGSNQAQLTKLNSNDGAIYGLSFGSYIPLNNQKFNIQLNSGIGSRSTTFIAYLYFHSLLSM